MPLPLGYAGALVGQVGFEPTGVPAFETGAYAVPPLAHAMTTSSLDWAALRGAELLPAACQNYCLARLAYTPLRGAPPSGSHVWGDRRESNPSFQGHVLAGYRYTTTTTR